MAFPSSPTIPRLAVDIGGTFTDVVVEWDTHRATAKVLTTPKAPEEGVFTGVLEALGRAELDPGAVGLILHGTTLATNAILERRGAVTALITTEGFRDVLAIGDESRYDQYDLYLDKPVPLVPPSLRLPVPERIDVTGRIRLPLDLDAVAAALPSLDRAGVESVAVGFLHAYINPVHEGQVGELLARERPQWSVTLSSQVCPEVREYPRLSTAVANAYVRPAMDRYLSRLASGLEARGLGCPVLLMTSGGGLTTLDTARRFPIRLVESGPAGGAILAAHLARQLDLPQVVSFDMGGTTAKVCFIDAGTPQTAREFEVDRAARFLKGSGLPLRIPVIEMVEIGAGGGSMARVDALGQIAVGPHSAGAEPGPAAYGRGGDRATVTDADVQLGRIDPADFAGGRVTLVPAEAQGAIGRDIATPLGLDETLAAYGIAEMVDETMANAARVHGVERGKVIADYTLVAFGGAAPLHTGRLADKLGIHRIVVPRDAGVGSAVGFLRAPVAFEVVRSRPMPLGDFDPEPVNALLEAMAFEALEVVRAAAFEVPIQLEGLAHMRYMGQGHEIPVALPPTPLGAGDRATLQQAFDAEYRRRYRRTIPNAEVEVLTWALTATAPRAVDPRSPPPPLEGPPNPPWAPPPGPRRGTARGRHAR
ncbi:MAG: hydantoinase/oxoprolinase family protein, partial [Candidatus Competibacterales bacterium]